MNAKTMPHLNFDLDRYGLASFDAVIVANGEQPRHPVPQTILQRAPYVVCCDGAIAWNGRADAIVGDGDSIPSWASEQFGGILHVESEQADNDLTKATRFCIQQGFRRLAYLGATGLREDHTLGNISLIMRYARELDVHPVMVTNYGWFEPVVGERGAGTPVMNDAGTVAAPFLRAFPSFPGQQVSLFNFGCRQLRTEGLLYDGYPFTQWWQGTLNEAAGDTFTIEADGDYLVFRTFEAK